MDTRIDKSAGPYICDAGPRNGMYRIDIVARIYLTAEEAEQVNNGYDLIISLPDP